MDIKNYYATLNVPEKATTEEIKRSYRKLARQYHPDVSKLPDAEARFKEVNEAWEVLKDPQKRAQYDQMRAGGWQQQQQRPQGHQRQYSEAYTENDFSDFFNTFFQDRFQQQQARTQDVHAKIHIPLKLAYEGGEQAIDYKNLKIKIPKGVLQGSQLRLKGQGKNNGDLYVEIHIVPDPYFSLHHKDVHLKLPITPWEAALGATIDVPTLGGNLKMKIPPNSQAGQKLRLKGKGFPGSPPGDQYVILQIVTPNAQTDKAKALYQQMATEMPFNPRAQLGV